MVNQFEKKNKITFYENRNKKNMGKGPTVLQKIIFFILKYNILVVYYILGLVFYIKGSLNI
jgi:hypothetical protein